MITEDYLMELNPVNDDFDDNIEKIIDIQCLFEHRLNKIANIIKKQLGDSND